MSMFFAKLEMRQMFNAGSLSQSITPTPIVIAQPKLPANPLPNLSATTSTETAPTAKPEVYSKGGGGGTHRQNRTGPPSVAFSTTAIAISAANGSRLESAVGEISIRVSRAVFA